MILRHIAAYQAATIWSSKWVGYSKTPTLLTEGVVCDGLVGDASNLVNRIVPRVWIGLL